MSEAPPEDDPADAPAPLRSVHTDNFAAILHELGASLAFTTYQAGKLGFVRPDGDRLNTHFRGFNAPMGLAVAGDRMAVGTSLEIWEYHNVPAVAARREPLGRVDACFLPRSSLTTGNIHVHEMAWGRGDALWFVNTRFSCLCTRDPIHSFVPRWKPRFVSALTPEDRCHLNGLALVDGLPAFATAHGRSDEPAGWRAEKARGGVLLDVPCNEIVTAGLSMPHSPRWYDGRLWLLESGDGSFGYIDPATNRYECVVRLPGFTRGLDFLGPYAFVGLSQVRETAVFSGIPITERTEDRCCGVWAIDLRTGRVAAFLRFEDALREIFAVQVLPGRLHPDLVNNDIPLIADSFVVPDDALDQVPAPLRTRSRDAKACA